MVACLVCGIEVKIGTLCRDHAAALATCSDITAEQIVSPAIDGAEAWLIDQWGCTHPLRSPAVIGRAAADRSPGVLHPSVSVLHAQIEALGEEWRLVDRGSLNGTYLNQQRVRAAPLASGDLVRFGEVSFFFAGGPLPSVREAATTGRTVPTDLDELSFHAALARGEEVIEMDQRPGGGILRRGDQILLELAQLEFALLAVLAEARAEAADPELSFVASRVLADRLEFNSRRADGDNVRELVRRVRRKSDGARLCGLVDSRQRVGYRIGWEIAAISGTSPTSR